MAFDTAAIQGEARVGRELRALLRDPVYRGEGLPRGDGRLVLVLPGLFANDFYLEPMHRWLKRIGYRPLRSTLLLNAGCPQRLCEDIESHVRERRQAFRRSDAIAIIGHSRGGILGWTIAARMQDDVSALILLGFNPAPASLTLREPVGLWRLLLGSTSPEFGGAGQPLPAEIPITAEEATLRLPAYAVGVFLSESTS